MAGFNNESFKVVIGHAVVRAIGGVKEISRILCVILLSIQCVASVFLNGSEYFLKLFRKHLWTQNKREGHKSQS